MKSIVWSVGVVGSLVGASGAGAQTRAAPAVFPADPSAVGWLAGCWRAASGSSATEEHWMAPSGGLMVGMSRTVREDRARAWEFLLLRAEGGRLAYWAHPSGQDPTSFPAIAVSGDEAVFANPDHDFPQKIRYRRESVDRIVASVFGAADAADPAFELDYRRVPCPGVP